MSRIILALACACILASCSPPPFDVALEQSLLTAKKLTRDNAALVTTDSKSFNSSATEQVFYPQLLPSGTDFKFDYAGGIVVALGSGPGGPSIGIDALRSGASSLESYASQDSPNLNIDPNLPSYSVWPMKSGSSIFGIAYDSQNPTNSSFSVLTGNPAAAPPTLTPVASGPLFSLAFGLRALGASLFPMDAPTDEVHVLASDLMGNFSEARLTASSTGLGLSTTVRPALGPSLPFIPPGLKRCQYFYDENPVGDTARAPNRSYASWYDTATSSWKCYAWWEDPAGTLQQKELAIGCRVDALLSTGQLFSTQDSTGRVFNRDGTPLGTFPLGDLRFIGEEYAGGLARAYFSLALVYNNALHFNVYWIQTDQLKTLAN